MNVNFGYCIWLLCDKKNNLKKLTNGFDAHMSVNTNMNLQEAINMFENLLLYKNNSLIVDIMPKKIMSYNNGFNALYYSIKYSNKNINEKPFWWPENAHISIRYKYNKDFTSSEKKLNLLNNTCKMKGLRLMKCIGHHSKWQQIM